MFSPVSICLFVKPWLHVKYTYFEIILKLFWCFISHVPVTTDDGGYI